MSSPRRIRLGVALDGAGWHPAAWREPSSLPHELFSGSYWAELAREAEHGGLDFLTVDDALSLQSATPFAPDHRTDEVRGRLDAVLVASRIAPATRSIGLLPVATTTHTEPFHVATLIATLDHITDGRAGWQARISAAPGEARLFGRRDIPDLTGIDDPAAPAVVAELFDEASAAVDVARRLWDSWEDDAEIRDVATDRFLDRDKVHRIDAESRFFSVRGPSIVPRSPQGAPVVAALAHDVVPYRFAARSADVLFVTPRDADADAARILTAVREQERFVERSGEPLRVIADLVVLLDGPEETGADRLARLDAIDPLTSDTRVAVGSATELADEIEKLGELGYDGVRLRPAVATDDLPRISRELAPELRRRGLVPEGYEGTTLREHLGLPATVPSRYAPTADLQEAS